MKSIAIKPQMPQTWFRREGKDNEESVQPNEEPHPGLTQGTNLERLQRQDKRQDAPANIEATWILYDPARSLMRSH